MSAAFTLINDEPTPGAPPPKAAPMEQATGLLMLALRSLGKRFVAALLNLFGFATLMSAWWLWMSMPNPNPNQLISLGLYGVFVLGMNFLTRMKP